MTQLGDRASEMVNNIVHQLRGSGVDVISLGGDILKNVPECQKYD